jgi:predicted NAD-dependent protein-ADP-ribosyltransferase YbiA (DUF1768 family)
MIAIKRIKDPFGWMGNMSNYSVEYNGYVYKNAEQLFQCLRFDDTDIIEQLKNEKSPMGAKLLSISNSSKMIIEPGSEIDIENMRLIIGIKVNSYDWMRDELIKTGDEFIYEDVSNRKGGRNLLWGGYFDSNNEFIGQNILGKIWMEIRTIINKSSIF